MNPRHIVFPPSAKLGAPMATDIRPRSRLERFADAVGNVLLLVATFTAVIIVMALLGGP